MTYRGLEAVVDANIDEISGGCAWIMLGKYQSTRGCKKWEILCVFPDSAGQRDFGDMREFLNNDENCILFNGYENAWVGVDGMGGDANVKEVAKRLKKAYDTGFCRATHQQIDDLMPRQLYDEMMEGVNKRKAYLLTKGYTADQLTAMGL